MLLVNSRGGATSQLFLPWFLIVVLCGRADYRALNVQHAWCWEDGKTREDAWADPVFQARCRVATAAPVLASRRGELLSVAIELERCTRGAGRPGAIRLDSAASILTDAEEHELEREREMAGGEIAERVLDAVLSIKSEGGVAFTLAQVKKGSGVRYDNDLAANGRIQMPFVRDDFAKGTTVEEVARLAAEHRVKALSMPVDIDWKEGEVVRPHETAKVLIYVDGKPADQVALCNPPSLSLSLCKATPSLSDLTLSLRESQVSSDSKRESSLSR